MGLPGYNDWLKMYGNGYANVDQMNVPMTGLDPLAQNSIPALNLATPPPPPQRRSKNAPADNTYRAPDDVAEGADIAYGGSGNAGSAPSGSNGKALGASILSLLFQ